MRPCSWPTSGRPAEPAAAECKKIHVICDNAKFHRIEAVMIYLWDRHGRIELQLPAAPQPGL